MVEFFQQRRSWAAAAVLVAAIVLALSYSPGMLNSRRAPSEYETVMYYFAQNVGAPALCGKIAWSAYQSYSVLFGGGGASYWRSDCYQQVAEARHDASICWKVRPLVDFDPTSSGYSALSCRRATHSGSSSGIALPDKLLVATFARLGYDIDQLHLQGVIEPAIRIRDVYWRLQQQPATLTRARQLVLQPSPSLQPGDGSFLADLVAVATADPKWCDSISATESMQQSSLPFRDWCYFTLAVNTQDIRVCDQMTPAAKEKKVREAEAAGVRVEIAEQLGLHAECDRGARRAGQRVHYSPEVPQDGEQTLRLLSVLQITMPSAHDWPLQKAAAYYNRFLFALRPSDQADSTRDAARATLVRRLLDLAPDF